MLFHQVKCQSIVDCARLIVTASENYVSYQVIEMLSILSCDLDM